MPLPTLSYEDFVGDVRLVFTPDQRADVALTANAVLTSLYEEVLGVRLAMFMVENDESDWPPLLQMVSNGFLLYLGADDQGRKFVGLKACAKWLSYFKLRASSDSRHTPTGNIRNVNENSEPATGDARRQAALIHNRAADELDKLFAMLSDSLEFEVVSASSSEIEIEGPNANLVLQGMQIVINGTAYKAGQCTYLESGNVVVSGSFGWQLFGQTGKFTPAQIFPDFRINNVLA